jgi:hypothetical protein
MGARAGLSASMVLQVLSVLNKLLREGGKVEHCSFLFLIVWHLLI